MCVWYRGERHTTKCEDRQQYVSVQLSGMAGSMAEGASTLDLPGSGQAASSGEPVFPATTIWVSSDTEEDEAEARDTSAGGEPVPMDVSSETELLASSGATVRSR